jgi:hypothetical protein
MTDWLTQRGMQAAIKSRGGYAEEMIKPAMWGMWIGAVLMLTATWAGAVLVENLFKMRAAHDGSRQGERHV